MRLPEQAAYELPLEPDGILPELYVGLAGRAILRVALKTRHEDVLVDIPPEVLQQDLDDAVDIVAAGGDRSEVAIWTRRPDSSSRIDGTAAESEHDISESGEYLGGRLQVDDDTGVVMVDGVKKGMTGREFDLLSLLTRHAGKVFTYPELAEVCRNPRRPRIPASVNSVQWVTGVLRRSVLGEALAKHIVVITGLGIKFEEDEAFLG